MYCVMLQGLCLFGYFVCLRVSCSFQFKEMRVLFVRYCVTLCCLLRACWCLCVRWLNVLVCAVCNILCELCGVFCVRVVFWVLCL